MGTRTVLVVDDESLFRQTVVSALTEWFEGIDAIAVCDGVEALEVLASRHVDVLVTDLQMPRMDGVTLLLEALNRGYPLSVVVTTAHTTPQLEQWARSDLVFAVLEKPVELADLIATIERLLEPAPLRHLDGVTLPGLCQILQIERRTCALRIRSGTRTGQLVFRDGMLEDAVHEGDVGDRAAIDILTWRGPVVEAITQMPARWPKRVTEDVVFLLMEAVRILDDRLAPWTQPEPAPPVRSSTPTLSPPPFLSPVWPTDPDPAAFWSVPTDSASNVSSAVPDVATGSLHEPAASPLALLTEQERFTQMASIRESLHKLTSLDGFVAAALVDGDSGMVLGSEALGAFNLEVAGAANSEVIRAKRKAISALALGDDIEDILITLGKQYHLIRPMKDRPMVFFYVVLERAKSSLALARIGVADAEKQVSF